MNERRNHEGPYKSMRPTPTRGGIVRLRDTPARASKVVADCDMAELQYAIQSVVGMGYAISFTATSDGGALSVVVFDGNIRWKAYERDGLYLPDKLHDLLDRVRGEE